MPRDALGEFEKIVMLAILQLGKGAYGATILHEIDHRTGRTGSAGAIYVALSRLEKKRMVSSEFGEPSPERGGRPKRYFRVEAEGMKALRRSQETWEAMSAGLDWLAEPEG